MERRSCVADGCSCQLVHYLSHDRENCLEVPQDYTLSSDCAPVWRVMSGAVIPTIKAIEVLANEYFDAQDEQSRQAKSWFCTVCAEGSKSVKDIKNHLRLR